MPRAEPLIGFFIGNDDGQLVQVAVYKAGRTFRLVYGGEKHLCHPSIRTVDLAKRETAHVFGVKVLSFEHC